jgi:hypothetical protein
MVRLLHTETKPAMVDRVSGDTLRMVSEGMDGMYGQKTFRNERLTYRLNIVAD